MRVGLGFVEKSGFEYGIRIFEYLRVRDIMFYKKIKQSPQVLLIL